MATYNLTFVLPADLVVTVTADDVTTAAETVEIPRLCHQCAGWGQRHELELGEEMHLVSALDLDTDTDLEIEPEGPSAEVQRLRARVAELEAQLSQNTA
ncbi:hypothetical protein [Streptomonospora wellingtoniae]|uniref:Uncharacterized protein n=1 Tax=Streptomonospora wellingtoniae TaxID=3075544 RepID=A0ABU2KUG5_9ACTN|nr:hypothetical protein [Streptomonospora sp. DSM 45055]MDT0302942.1 hypothetical protein [Streptomonospora sp. DSM 45055]